MLQRKRRLPTKLFEEVMKLGRTYHSAHLSLRLYRFKTQESSRFSFSVPKKLEKRAHCRNLLKRQCSEAVFKQLPNVPDGFGGIFFAKKGISEISFKDLEQEVAHLLQTLKSDTIN